MTELWCGTCQRVVPLKELHDAGYKVIAVRDSATTTMCSTCPKCGSTVLEVEKEPVLVIPYLDPFRRAMEIANSLDGAGFYDTRQEQPAQAASPLTPEEMDEGEFESRYGHSETTFQVDHKGRVFVTSEMDGEPMDVIVLNEAADALTVLPKIIALCQTYLREYADIHGMDGVSIGCKPIGGEGVTADG